MKPHDRPHPIDRVIRDLDQVTLGGVTLVAHLTPGHTKGCTTWTTTAAENGKTFSVVIGCGIGAVGRPLLNNKEYPDVIADYRRSYKEDRFFPRVFFVKCEEDF